MIQKLLLIITALFLLTNTAFAVHWKYLAEREDVLVYIDTDSITNDDNVVTFQELWNSKKPRFLTGSSGSLMEYNSCIHHEKYNVAEGSGYTERYFYYSGLSGSGDLIESDLNPSGMSLKTSGEAFPPGSWGELVMKFLLKNMKKLHSVKELQQ